MGVHDDPTDDVEDEPMYGVDDEGEEEHVSPPPSDDEGASTQPTGPQRQPSVEVLDGEYTIESDSAFLPPRPQLPKKIGQVSKRVDRRTIQYDVETAPHFDTYAPVKVEDLRVGDVVQVMFDRKTHKAHTGVVVETFDLDNSASVTFLEDGTFPDVFDKSGKRPGCPVRRVSNVDIENRISLLDWGHIFWVSYYNELGFRCLTKRDNTYEVRQYGKGKTRGKFIGSHDNWINACLMYTEAMEKPDNAWRAKQYWHSAGQESDKTESRQGYVPAQLKRDEARGANTMDYDDTSEDDDPDDEDFKPDASLVQAVFGRRKPTARASPQVWSFRPAARQAAPGRNGGEPRHLRPGEAQGEAGPRRGCGCGAMARRHAGCAGAGERAGCGGCGEHGEAEAFESDLYGSSTEEGEEEPAKVTKHRGVILLRTNRGKTGYLGVTKKDGKYQAQYRDKYLGIFDDMLDAAAEVSWSGGGRHSSGTAGRQRGGAPFGGALPPLYRSTRA